MHHTTLTAANFAANDDGDQFAPATATYSIAFVGPARAGKTSIIRRFLNNEFNEEYSTTGAIYMRPISKNKDDINYHFELNDTPSSGAILNGGLQNILCNQSNLVVFVFDCRDRSQYDQVKDMMRKVKLQLSMGKRLSFALVASHADMRAAIIDEEAIALAARYNSDFYMVSAKTGDGIQELFDDLLSGANNLVPHPRNSGSIGFFQSSDDEEYADSGNSLSNQGRVSPKSNTPRELRGSGEGQGSAHSITPRSPRPLRGVSGDGQSS